VEVKTQAVLGGDSYIAQGSLCEVGGNVSDRNLGMLWRNNMEFVYCLIASRSDI